MHKISRITFPGWIGFLVLISANAFASNSSPQCSSYHSHLLGHKVNYCVDRTTPNQPALSGEPVAYFMHGTNGNAQTWTKNNYAASLATLRANGALPPMTFVSFDTSAYSFFTDHPADGSGPRDKAYETWFIEEFVPFIEQTLDVCRKRECRAMIGESMGGFGALKTTLKHLDLFSAVAVNSPALPPFSVRAPLCQWEKFWCHEPIGPILGFVLIEIVRGIFPTDVTYDDNNPLALSENFPADSIYPYPPIYFDMGGKDTYGFNVGYGLLEGIFNAKQIPYTTIYEPQAGHDMWERHAGDAIKFLLDHVGKS